MSNITHVEETYSKGKRDRDLESVRTPCLEEKICVSTSSRKLTWLFDKIAQLEDVYLKLKRTWKQEKREKRSSDMALFETNRELESQRLELYQGHQWADQAQRERINSCGELEMRNRLLSRSGRIAKNLLRSNK